jgi:O-antigen/teichoic acid export membrane protein
MGVVTPLRLLGLFVAIRSLTTFLPNVLNAIGNSAFVMWTMVGSAIAMPIVFLIGSHWGTTGIAGGWLVAYPIIIAPIYYRMFQKTDMTAKEYVAVLLPSVNASALMAAVLFGIRAVIPAKLPAVLGLSILTIGGAIAYWCALYAFHRARVLHLMNTIKRMVESR